MGLISEHAQFKVLDSTSTTFFSIFLLFCFTSAPNAIISSYPRKIISTEDETLRWGLTFGGSIAKAILCDSQTSPVANSHFQLYNAVVLACSPSSLLVRIISEINYPRLFPTDFMWKDKLEIQSTEYTVANERSPEWMKSQVSVYYWHGHGHVKDQSLIPLGK